MPNQKIVIISSLQSFSTAVYMIEALIDLGKDLYVISDLEHPLADTIISGAFNLPSLLKKNNIHPSLVIFIEGGSMNIFPIGLNELKCLNVWYGIDTHMDFIKHLQISKVFDVTFIAQLEYVDELKARGIEQVYWLPLGFDQKFTKYHTLDKKFDVAYVGSINKSINPERHRLLDLLAQEFPNHYFGQASPNEMAKIYAQTRIVFNMSIKNDINMRIFEATGSGAVLLTNPIFKNGIEELFKEGEHYLTYSDEVTLLYRVKELLADASLQRKIQVSAQEHTLANHTYNHRIKELLTICESSNVKKIVLSPEAYMMSLLSQGFVGSATNETAILFRLNQLKGFPRIKSLFVYISLRIISKIVIFIEWLKRIIN